MLPLKTQLLDNQGQRSSPVHILMMSVLNNSRFGENIRLQFRFGKLDKKNKSLRINWEQKATEIEEQATPRIPLRGFDMFIKN